ncbi:MAG: hypothetical protein AAB225_26120, partial [Acidobacteriota bacterium]
LGAESLLLQKRNDLVPRPALSLLRSGEDCLYVEGVLRGLFLTNTPDILDNVVLRHGLFSQEFFRRADDRTLKTMLPAGIGHCPGCEVVRAPPATDKSSPRQPRPRAEF